MKKMVSFILQKKTEEHNPNWLQISRSSIKNINWRLKICKEHVLLNLIKEQDDGNCSV